MTRRRSKSATTANGASGVYCVHNALTAGAVPWICTRKVAMRLCPDAPNFQHQTLRYYFELNTDDNFERHLAMPPHRAGPDAYVTAHLLARCDLRRSFK